MNTSFDENYVFFTDGVVVGRNSFVVSAGFTEAPDAATSRIYLKFDEEWLAHEVSHDFIVSVAHRNGELMAVGKNGLVKSAGTKGVQLSAKTVAGKFRDFQVVDAESRGHLERVRGIGESFYACGWGGQFYQLQRDSWHRFETGLDLNREDDFLDLDGSSEKDIYVAGLNGVAAHYDGARWRYLDLPTNAHIYSVLCLAPGDVVLAGARGTLLRGNFKGWVDLSDSEIDSNFWALGLYREKLYISYGDKGLYVFSKGKYSEVDFGLDQKPTTNRLGALDNELWSFGSAHLLKFDGKSWDEFACPDNS